MTDTDQDVGTDDTDPIFGNDKARIKDTVTDQDGNALDLSAVNTIEFEVFQDRLGGTSELSKTDSDAAVSVTGASNDVVEIDLSPTDTDALAPSRGSETYVYRVRVTDSAGDPDTVTTGDLEIRAG